MENKQVTGKELKAAYQRKWRAAHPKAAADHQKQYWERKAAAMNEAAGVE